MLSLFYLYLTFVYIYDILYLWGGNSQNKEDFKMVVKTSFGKISASKDTLNYIFLMMNEASESYESRGRSALSREALNNAYAIHDALESVGFYDNVK